MYLPNKHFENILLSNNIKDFTLERLSNNAVKYTVGKYVRGIIYCSTIVFEFDFDTINLRTGGRKTQTTKRRINEGLKLAGVRYNLYQKKGIRYINDTDDTYVAVNNITIFNETNK